MNNKAETLYKLKIKADEKAWREIIDTLESGRIVRGTLKIKQKSLTAQKVADEMRKTLSLGHAEVKASSSSK